MHVTETWAERVANCAVVRTSRCDASPLLVSLSRLTSGSGCGRVSCELAPARLSQGDCAGLRLVQSRSKSYQITSSKGDPQCLSFIFVDPPRLRHPARVCSLSVGTVTEEVLATPRSSHDGMRSPRPSLSGPAVEHLAVQVCCPAHIMSVPAAGVGSWQQRL